jgi:hypothetical protein
MTPKNPETITPNTGFYIVSNDITDGVDNRIYIKVYQINYIDNQIDDEFVYDQSNFTESSIPSSKSSSFNTGNIGLRFDIYIYDSNEDDYIATGDHAFNIDFTLPEGYVILDDTDLQESLFTTDDSGVITSSNNDITVTMPSQGLTTYNFTTTNVNKISIHVGIPCRDD